MRLHLTILMLALIAIVSVHQICLASVEPFSFAVVTDSHILTRKAIDDYTAVLSHIKCMGDTISFVIHTGDITSYGYPEEFEAFTTATRSVLPSTPMHVCAGNHDTRWSNTGKENFRRLIGKSNYSFDHKGLHFVIMDSSMLIEQYGHFEPKDLSWLRKDLASLPEGTPAIIAFHHPPFHENLFIDNEHDFLDTIAPFNVPLILCGHTHTNATWRVNGTTIYTSDATLQRLGYSLAEVTGDTITLYSSKAGTDTLKNVVRVPLQKRPAPKISIEPLDTTTSFTLVVRAEGFEKAAYMLDFHRGLAPLKTIADGMFAEQLPWRELPEGMHQVIITLESPTHGEWHRRMHFLIGDYRCKVVFSVPTGGALQSSPVIQGDRIVFGSNDENVYCVDSKSGAILWRHRTGAEVIAIPAIFDNTAVVGSLDGTMYALSLKDGGIRWKNDVGAPIPGSALVTDTAVIFGAGDYILRSLDRQTGSLQWTFSTGRLIKMRPAHAEGRVLFGSWDGFFYCLNEQDGSLLWKQKMSEGMTFAPATSNPVVSGNKVIFVTHDYVTHCFDITDGRELWSYPNTDSTRPSYSSGTLWEDTVVYGSITGHVVAFGVQDGGLRFATPLTLLGTEDPIFDSSPAIWNDTAFVGSVGSYVYGINCKNGDVTWRFSLQDGSIFSSPLVADGIIYVGTNGGRLSAIQLEGSISTGGVD